MDYKLLCIILGIILGLVVIASLFINFRLSRTLKVMQKREVEGIKEKNGVRYTVGQEIYNEDGEAKISLSQKDVTLLQNKTLKVGKGLDVKPGKYTILTTNDDNTAFNVRIGGLVREYHHGDSIVLVEGDEITCVSHSLILR